MLCFLNQLAFNRLNKRLQRTVKSYLPKDWAASHQLVSLAATGCSKIHETQNLKVFFKRTSSGRALCVCGSQEGSQLSTFSPALFRWRHLTHTVASFVFALALVFSIIWSGQTFLTSAVICWHCASWITFVRELWVWFRGQFYYFSQKLLKFERPFKEAKVSKTSFENCIWNWFRPSSLCRSFTFDGRKRKKSVLKHPVTKFCSALAKSYFHYVQYGFLFALNSVFQNLAKLEKSEINPSLKPNEVCFHLCVVQVMSS